MSQAYRAYSPAQAIEEAVVIAAALLAAVEAPPVRSTTPSPSSGHKLWTTLAVIAFATLAGAVVFGGGRTPSSVAPPSAAEPAIAVAAPAAPEPERVIAADVAPPSQRAMD